MSKKPAKPRPKMHFIGAGEGIPMAITSDLSAVVRRGSFPFVEDNSDIGIRRGRRSSEAVVCEEAERWLKAGWSAGNKWVLAEHLSNWLARHHRLHDPDAPVMAASVVYRNQNFTRLWRKYHPRRRQNSRQKI
jgi:hypothetical protein